jgi:septum formation protein
MRIILASASPARLSTLRNAGVDAEVIVSGVDEDAITAADPTELVAKLAQAKATAVADSLPASSIPTLVIGCDSLFVYAGQVYGKPGTAESAAARAKMMSGQTGTLLTGHHVIKLDGGTRRERNAVGSTEVTFAQLDDDEIDAYVVTGEPLQVAGGFTIDGLGGPFIAGLRGDHHNVVGISLPLLREMLRALGVPWASLWAN